MSLNTVSILDGNAFVVSDRRGDIDASPVDAQGLFLDDTRFLSRWILTVNGLRPSVLSVDEQEYFQVQFFEAVTTGTIYVDSHLSVARKRAVGKGFHEEILLENHDKEAIDLDVKLDAGCDFADLFEVKDKLSQEGGALHEGDERSADVGIQTRRLRARDVHLGQPEGRHRRGRSSFSRSSAAAHLLDRLPRRAGLRARHRRRADAHQGQRRRLGEQRPPAGLFVGTAAADLPPQPGGHGGLALPDRNHPRRAAGGGAPLVHGGVRPRQPDHQLSGHPLRAGAGGVDLAHLGSVPGSGRRIPSATRSLARSCTSCASAR